MQVATVGAVLALTAGLTAACSSGSGTDAGRSSRPPVTSPASTASAVSSPVPSPTGTPDASVDLAKGDAPQNPILAYGALWVPAHHAGVVVRIDPDTGRVVARIPTGDSPGGVVGGAGLVWVAHYGETHLLVAIDPTTNRVVRRVRLTGESCCQPAVLGSTVWVTAAPDVVGIGARDGKVHARIRDMDGPVVVHGELWGTRGGEPVRVDLATHKAAPLGGPGGYFVNAGAEIDGLAWAWTGTAIAGVGPDGAFAKTIALPASVAPDPDGVVVASGDVVWAVDLTHVLRAAPGATTAELVAERDDLLSVVGDGHGGAWVTGFGNDTVEHFAAP